MKEKLLSRKLWMAIAGFVSMLIIAFGGSVEGAAQVAAIIMAGATIIGYAIGQGLVDASANSAANASVSADYVAVVTDGKTTSIGSVPAQVIVPVETPLAQ